MKNTQSGFSLVELIVSVGIIGILSAISIPNVMSFTRRAKQKEGMAMLSTLYGSMRTSRAQLEFFPGDFVAAGYRPEGEIDYHIFLHDGGYTPLYPTNWYCNESCINTTVTDCQIYKTGLCDGSGTSLGQHLAWTASPNAYFPISGDPARLVCNPGAGAQNFQACAYGDLGGNQLSIISVDEGKNLLILQDGTEGN